MKALVEQGMSILHNLHYTSIKKGKEQAYTLTEEQRKKYIQAFGKGKDDSVNIQRYKGLGEMNAEQIWDTTMNPNTRTLKRVTIDSAAEADKIFSMLMGEEVPPRREFIETHAEYARIGLEIQKKLFMFSTFLYFYGFINTVK